MGYKGSVAEAYALWFKKKQCDNDDCPTDSTLKTYGYSMQWMAQRMEGFDVEKEMVPTPEKVLGYMEDNKVGTGRRVQSYTALKVFHRCFRNCKENQSHRKTYGVPLVQCRRKVEADYRKQERTPKQIKNWVDKPVLKKYSATLRKKAFALNKNELWTKGSFATAQMAFIMTYLMTYPIRRDLPTVQWGVEPSVKINYVDDTRRAIVYNVHKSARWDVDPETKIRRPTVHALSRPMWRLLKLLRKQQKMREIESGFILLNCYWRPMKKNAYSGWLKRELKKCPGCEDKNVTSMPIRNSVITHKRGNCMTLAQRDTFGNQCMHSASTNEIYRRH
jgi:hypothetical protein